MHLFAASYVIEEVLLCIIIEEHWAPQAGGQVGALPGLHLPPSPHLNSKLCYHTCATTYHILNEKVTNDPTCTCLSNWHSE